MPENLLHAFFHYKSFSINPLPEESRQLPGTRQKLAGTRSQSWHNWNSFENN
jgi:hypothetical protein